MDHSESGQARRKGLALALCGLWLALLGFFHQQALVFNKSDNAYLWVWMVGFALMVTAVPFLVASALPVQRARRALAWVGVGLLWLVGVLGGVMMGFALAIIPTQSYRTDTETALILAHVASLVTLVATVYVIGLRFRRRLLAL